MKKKILLIILAVVVLAAAGFGIYRLATFETANHADRMSDSKVMEYNTIITGKAQIAGRIGAREILILHSLQKDMQTDSQLVFYIYQLPEGAKIADYIGLRTSQITEEHGLIHMGSFSCRMVGEDLSSAYSVQVSYIR